MKYIKLVAGIMIAVMIMLPGYDSIYAHGGGGGGGVHASGSHGGGVYAGGSHGGGIQAGRFYASGGWHGGGRCDCGCNEWNGYSNNVYVEGGYDDGSLASTATAPNSGQDTEDSSAVSTDYTERSSVEVVRQPSDSSVPIGTIVAMLPPGSQDRNIGEALFYQCGSVWYKPYLGSSGVYYEIVPPPPAGNQ